MATDPTQIGIRAKPVAFSQQGTAVKLGNHSAGRAGRYSGFRDGNDVRRINALIVSGLAGGNAPPPYLTCGSAFPAAVLLNDLERTD